MMSDGLSHSTTTTWGASSSTDGGSFFTPSAPQTRRDPIPPPAKVSKALVDGMRSGLNFFDRIAVDRASREETRRIAGELIVQMLAAQREKIVYQIVLDLDAEKKHLFAEAMREGSRIEKEIAERSTEFERQLMDLALDHGFAGHVQTKARLNRLEQSHAAGQIDDSAYDAERANILTWSRIFSNNLNAKVELILRNHAGAIERTLRLFQERAIPGHAA